MVNKNLAADGILFRGRGAGVSAVRPLLATSLLLGERPGLVLQLPRLALAEQGRVVTAQLAGQAARVNKHHQGQDRDGGPDQQNNGQVALHPAAGGQ